jgi:DNA-binding transcriptional regulator GbsR (MarR family)
MKEKPFVFEQEFQKLTSEFGEYLGLNRTVGQIYGLLFMSSAPVSLDTIVGTLKISKGGVSVNIRELERWGAVKKVWVQGSRKDFYEANHDFVNVAYARIKNRMKKMLDSAERSTADFESRNNLTEEQKNKLNQIKEIVSLFGTVLKMSPEDISVPKIKKFVAVISTLKKIV